MTRLGIVEIGRSADLPLMAQPIATVVDRALSAWWPELPIRSRKTDQMPMNGLLGIASCATIWTSHPSHRSFLRKVTCIKDGFFFCAEPNRLRPDVPTEACP